MYSLCGDYYNPVCATFSLVLILSLGRSWGSNQLSYALDDDFNEVIDKTVLAQKLYLMPSLSKYITKKLCWPQVCNSND